MDVVRLIRKVDRYYVKVRNFRSRLKATVNQNKFLKYVFSLTKCLLLYRLGSDLTAEAASFQSLLFVSLFHLKTLSFLSGLKVLSGQLFWITTAHFLKQHFTSNAVMSILLTFDSEMAAIQDELLKTQLFLLLFPGDRSDLCLAVSLGISLFRYFRQCEKCSDDWFLFFIWAWSYYTWFPKLTSFPVFVTLALWIWFTLIR